MNEIAQGWTLSVVGVLVAFLFMAVFIGIMVVLQRLFPYKEEAQAEEGEAASAEPVALVESDQADDAVIAAIAAALAVAKARQAPGIGDGLVAGRGSWWVANRMASRQGVNIVRK